MTYPHDENTAPQNPFIILSQQRRPIGGDLKECPIGKQPMQLTKIKQEQVPRIDRDTKQPIPNEVEIKARFVFKHMLIDDAYCNRLVYLNSSVKSKCFTFAQQLTGKALTEFRCKRKADGTESNYIVDEQLGAYWKVFEDQVGQFFWCELIKNGQYTNIDRVYPMSDDDLKAVIAERDARDSAESSSPLPPGVDPMAGYSSAPSAAQPGQVQQASGATATSGRVSFDDDDIPFF